MSRKETKQTKKDHYVKQIAEKEPVRPSELEFKRVRYDYLKELKNEGRIDREDWGKNYTLFFMPGHKDRANERFDKEALKSRGISARQNQEIRIDFKPDIENWLDQNFSYWNKFFSPWFRSDEVFDGNLPIENRPSFPFFKKYVKDILVKKPGFCQDPFIENEKLKNMATRFNKSRDNLLNEFKSIINKKYSFIKKKIPNFDKNIEQKLLEIIVWKTSVRYLQKENFHKSFVIGLDEPNPFIPEVKYDEDTKIETIYLSELSEEINSEKQKEILNSILHDVDMSRIITRKKIVELWTMISEAQTKMSKIERSLELLNRLES